MSKNSICCTWVGCAVIAFVALTSSAARADTPADENKNAARVVVAQAPTPDAVHAREVASPAEAFPAHERGVRQAAALSNEALRRYVWRTRMIYNFYFNDFVPKE